MDENYLSALNLFYNNSATCPGCPGAKIIRGSTDSKLTMSCASKKCKWNVEISLPVIDDIFVKEAGLKLKQTNAAYSMIDAVRADDKDKFEDAKKMYSEITGEWNVINERLTEEEKTRTTAFQSLSELRDKLQDLYYKRKAAFPAEVLKKTTQEGVQKTYALMRDVKSGQKQFEEALGMKNGADKVMEWVSLCREYTEISKQLVEQQKKVEKMLREQDQNDKYTVFTPPSVSGGPLTTGPKKIKKKIK